MFTEAQNAALNQIALESVDLGVRDQLAEDPCDWVNAFDHAEQWARSKGEHECAQKLAELSRRTTTVLEEATS
jgi:hypothetical protein